MFLDSMWAEGNGTTVVGRAGSVSSPTPAPNGMENMPGMSTETASVATTTRAGLSITPGAASPTSSGASFGLSQTSSRPAQASTAGAQPVQLNHAGASLAGLLGVVAYGLMA